MNLLKAFKNSLKVLVVFVGITAVFSLPGLVRCGGSVDTQGVGSGYASVYGE